MIFQVQSDFVDIVQEHFSPNGLVVKCLEFAFKQEHIMDFTRMRALESLFSMIHQGVRNVLQYNQQHPDFPMEVSKYVINFVLLVVIATCLRFFMLSFPNCINCVFNCLDLLCIYFFISYIHHLKINKLSMNLLHFSQT